MTSGRPGARGSRPPAWCAALIGPGLFLSLALAPRATAQEGSLSFDLGASHSRPPAGASASASSYAHFGMRAEARIGDGFFFGAAYSGLSLAADGANWASALAGGGFLAPISGTVALGLSVAGEAFRVEEPLSYQAATVQAEPEIRVTTGGTTLRLKGYGGIGRSEVAVVDSFFRLTRLGPVLFRAGTVVQTDLWAWGGGLELSNWLGQVQPRASLEVYDARQGRYVAGRVGLLAVLARVAWNMELALWDTPAGRELVLTATLEVPLSGGFGGLLGGGRFGPDPLLDSPAAESAAATMSWEAVRFGHLDAPHSMRFDGRTYVSFEIARPDAAVVAVAGEFTDWKDVPMLSRSGVWSVEIPVDPGAYRYGFQVDGEWYVPCYAAGLAEDEWGEMHLTLVVPER